MAVSVSLQPCGMSVKSPQCNDHGTWGVIGIYQGVEHEVL